MNYPTALIADDEPLLRDALARQLAQAWPELLVVAQARNGRDGDATTRRCRRYFDLFRSSRAGAPREAPRRASP